MVIRSSSCEYPDEHRDEITYGRLCFLIFCMACLVRIYFYIFPKDLWLDEAMIAVAIDRASWSEILRGQLIYNQCCPIFFAVYNKILNTCTSYSPHVVYFLPMIAGIFLLWSLIKLCKIYENSNFLALICIIIVASCKFALYYSIEFKQYIFEGIVSICILTVFIRDINNEKIVNSIKTINTQSLPDCTEFLSYKYPILFSIAILVSSPSIFISAGIFFAIFLYLLKNSELSFGKIVKLLISRYIFFVIVCILYYLLYLRNKQMLQAMQEYWKPYFVPLDLSLWPDYFKNVVLANWGGMFSFSSPFSWQSGVFAISIFISFASGCYYLFKRNKYEFIACVFPFIFAIIAAFGFYPPGSGGFAGARLSFYLFPVVIFIASIGFYNISNKLLKYREKSIKYALILCSILTLYVNIGYAYSSSLEYQQTFLFFNKIYEGKKSDDYVLVYPWTIPALEYWEISNKKKINYNALSVDRIKNHDKNIGLNFSEDIFLHDNIFIVYSHRHYIDCSNMIKEALTKHGYNVETFDAKGAVLQKAARVS